MIPVYIKRKMLMAPDTHRALTDAGFRVIPINKDICSIDDGILWNWGWYGGELYAPILLNDPRFIRETTVRGCFEKHGELMPLTATSVGDLHVAEDAFIICKNNGYKGIGKVICRWYDAPEGYDIYQEFLGDDREEYRALMIGDKRIVSYRKLIEDKYNPRCDKVYKMCGGRRSGEDVMPKILRKLARTVMRESDLDILGLDLMLTSDGNAYLTELNSAPGIGEYTAERVMAFLQRSYGDEDE